MNFKFFSILLLVFGNSSILATVILTHGLGTQGIEYYQKSLYIDLIRESAQKLGHETICLPWLEPDNKAQGFAGILPQERIASAVKIAKKILDEIKAKNRVFLIGHGYGGQVMACATRLINPENAVLTDSFIYELIYTIKNYNSDEQTRTISPQSFIEGIILGWKVSKKIFDAIESSNLVNQNLIKLVKQNLSFQFIEETKMAWDHAFDEVQTYKKKLFKNGFDCKNSIDMIYTIGTVNNEDMAFTPDMKVVQQHVNFYSTADTIISFAGKKIAQQNTRTANIEVLFEPTKGVAPKHDNFCGNVLMAPWILLIPQNLKAMNLGGFEKFEWGKKGTITFYSDKIPAFKSEI